MLGTCVCVCVCVCVLYSSIIVYDEWKVSFCCILIFHDCDTQDMMIWLVWVMFLFIFLIIVICLLVLLLACMKMNVFDESLFWISRQCFIYSLLFSLFLYFVILLLPLYIYISYKVMFSIFLSSSVLTFSLTLFLLISVFHSLTLYHSQSLNDIAWFDKIYCILWYYIW